MPEKLENLIVLLKLGLLERYLKQVEMVFSHQNCSDLLWEKKCSSDREKLLKFEAEGREFANNLRSLDQFIKTVEGWNNFW